MKTIALAMLTAWCWLVAGEMVWGQSALQRLEEDDPAAKGRFPRGPRQTARIAFPA